MNKFAMDRSLMSKIKSQMIMHFSRIFAIVIIFSIASATAIALETETPKTSETEQQVTTPAFVVTYIDSEGNIFKATQFAVSYHGVDSLATPGENLTLSEYLIASGITLSERDVMKVVRAYDIPDSHALELDRDSVINPYACVVISGKSIVRPFTKVVIDEVYTENSTVTETIPYSLNMKYSASMPSGETRVISEGKEGVKTTVISRSYFNGNVVSENIVSSAVTTEPQNKVVLNGTGDTGVVNQPGSFVNAKGETINYKYYIDVIATAYGYVDGSHTCTGKNVDYGMIAVDPKVISLGTTCYVTGEYGDYGYQVAEDVGGGIKGNRIDLFLGDNATVNAFGVRSMRVYVIG